MSNSLTSLFWRRFRQMPIIGISRNIPAGDLMSILPHYEAAGLQCVEITMNSLHAAETIKEAGIQFGELLSIGAGTVCTVRDLEIAVGAGATFIVTPIVNEEVIRACRQQSIPIFTGAFSPTEIYKAWHAGSDVVKLFPASSIDPGYVREILGPFSEIKLLPTGGVGPDDALAFLKAGAAGVGMGSQLFDKTLLKLKNWSGLEVHFRTVTEKIGGMKTDQ